MARRLFPGIGQRFPDVRNTTAFRLTAGLSVMFTVAAVALIAVISALTETELTVRTDQVLSSEMHRLTVLPPARLPQEIRALMAGSASGLSYYALAGPDGRVMVGNMAFRGAPGGAGAFEIDAGAATKVPLRALITRLPTGDRIEVARDITQIIDLRHRITVMLVYSGMVVIVAALLAGALLSRGPLQRVAKVRAVAMRIAAGELGLRMPVTARGDELDLIAGMVNAMLDEIERLMDQVKGATDAIAHDLRTPLAHLRQRLQGLMRHNGDDPIAPIVADAIVDVDLVLSRFNALLRISELEASGRQAGFAPVDPMALLADIAELYEPLAEQSGIEMSIHGAFGMTILGDETLLLEVVNNLVENALKFVGAGGRVVLSVTGDHDAVVIEVRDDGPGIPEAERKLVLGRFRRGSGAGRTAGMGLGLNLVAAIVHLHGFAMALEDAAPGLIFKICCPRHGSRIDLGDSQSESR
jgi:signal transduction histidine kinase